MQLLLIIAIIAGAVIYITSQKQQTATTTTGATNPAPGLGLNTGMLAAAAPVPVNDISIKEPLSYEDSTVKKRQTQITEDKKDIQIATQSLNNGIIVPETVRRQEVVKPDVKSTDPSRTADTTQVRTAEQQPRIRTAEAEIATSVIQRINVSEPVKIDGQTTLANQIPQILKSEPIKVEPVLAATPTTSRRTAAPVVTKTNIPQTRTQISTPVTVKPAVIPVTINPIITTPRVTTTATAPRVTTTAAAPRVTTTAAAPRVTTTAAAPKVTTTTPAPRLATTAPAKTMTTTKLDDEPPPTTSITIPRRVNKS